MRSDPWDLTWQRGIGLLISSPEDKQSILHDLDGHDGITRVLKRGWQKSRSEKKCDKGQSHGMGDELDPSLLVLKMEERSHKPRKSEHL